MIQGFPAEVITELLKDVDDHIHDQRIQLLVCRR